MDIPKSLRRFAQDFKTTIDMTIPEFNFKVSSQEKPLKHFALQLTRNEEDANDLVQETMLKAFTYREKFMDGTNLKGWLYTIMKNSFINNYRRIVKRNTFIDSTENNYYLDSSSNVTENQGETKFLRKDLEHAIKSLSDDLKITFELNMLGFKYHEIAEELNIPIGTVKTRIFVAKRKLRDRLKSYAESMGLEQVN